MILNAEYFSWTRRKFFWQPFGTFFLEISAYNPQNYVGNIRKSNRHICFIRIGRIFIKKWKISNAFAYMKRLFKYEVSRTKTLSARHLEKSFNAWFRLTEIFWNTTVKNKVKVTTLHWKKWIIFNNFLKRKMGQFRDYRRTYNIKIVINLIKYGNFHYFCSDFYYNL